MLPLPSPCPTPQAHPPTITQQKRIGTYQTEQNIMLPPPGKPCHFVDRKEDEAGPCGVSLHPNRPFTRVDMESYLPGSLLPANTEIADTNFPIIQDAHT